MGMRTMRSTTSSSTTKLELHETSSRYVSSSVAQSAYSSSSSATSSSVFRYPLLPLSQPSLSLPTSSSLPLPPYTPSSSWKLLLTNENNYLKGRGSLLYFLKSKGLVSSLSDGIHEEGLSRSSIAN